MPRAAFLLVPAGIAAGHAGAYALADPHSAPAHGYFPLFAAGGLLTLLVTLVWSVSREAGGRPLRISARLLALAQVGGFIALEVAERAAAGHTVEHLLTEPVLWVGLAAQLVVALVLRVGFRWLPHVLVSLLRRRHTALSESLALPRFRVGAEQHLPAVLSCGATPRAPPVLG